MPCGSPRRATALHGDLNPAVPVLVDHVLDHRQPSPFEVACSVTF